MKKSPRLVHLIIINMIRASLLVAFFYTDLESRPVIKIISLIAIFITFIPYIFEKLFKINIPSAFEVIYLMGIYGILIFGELRGYFSGIWWWSFLITITASIALGFISLTIVQLLYNKNKIAQNQILTGIIIFSFTVTLGIFWEIFEFTLDLIIKSGLQKNLIDTMQDILINIFGGLIVSILGSSYIKNEKDYLNSTFFSESLEKLLKIKKDNKESIKEKIIDIIKNGENEKIEFKSTIRTNLYTMNYDKRMELEILKTITAFLNTNGGTLMIGVSDKGEILGLDKDNFQNVDKIGLHLTNLIKSGIGNSFLPFIRFDIVKIDEKVIVLIKCLKSQKQVFLKEDGQEKFFVRNGPASIRLEGSAMVDYIKHKF